MDKNKYIAMTGHAFLDMPANSDEGPSLNYVELLNNHLFLSACDKWEKEGYEFVDFSFGGGCVSVLLKLIK